MPRFKPGQTLTMNGHQVTIGYVFEADNPPDCSHGPGTFCAIRHDTMPRDAWLILPAQDIALAADVDAPVELVA